MKRVELDHQRLRQMIEVQKLQHHQVAKLLGVSRDTILRRCRELNFATQRTGPRSGPGHTGWKGGRVLLKGYVYVWCPEHPNATKHGYVAEHRLVLEVKLGRYLLRSEVGHHIDGNRTNNDPANLMVFASNAEHLSHELKGRCPKWTPEGKHRILEAIRSRPNYGKPGRDAKPKPRTIRD